MQTSALARNPLFEGLSPQMLDEIASLMRPRHFDAKAPICRYGDPGNSLFVVVDGLAHVSVPDRDSGEQRVFARLRRGDVIGEMSLITGEPRSATVVAGIPTTALELGRDEFAAAVARHPEILANLSSILSRRLARLTERVGEERLRGEAVALVVDRSVSALVPELLAATQAASPRPVASFQTDASLASALAGLDDALAEHGTVILVAGVEQETLPLVLDHVDRAVALAGARGVERLDESLRHGPFQRIEAVLVADPSGRVGRASGEAIQVVRVIECELDGDSAAIPPHEVAWLGRHLSRTKLGLALGAGGAKGYAHVGALQVLERAGYTVDAVAGSSIGAVVGACLALGMDAAETETAVRAAFTPEVVEEIFKPSLSGASKGLETMTRVFRETTRDKSFEDLALPLVVMTVDLNSRGPAPVTEGPLWQALLAATALAGVFPPYERDGQRLVDGLALVPVPTGSVVEAGADISVSVNLMSRETLPAWPGAAVPPERPAGPGSRIVDTLLEVMDLAQLDSSIRHAALADVPITPRFGPSTWRDFHLADLFLEAGRQAAEEQLPLLESLARPQLSNLST